MAQNDDIQLHQYQDDLNTDDNAVDPIMSEETDDPTDSLQIPPSEFGAELDKLDFEDDLTRDKDDMRELVEDRDEDQNLKE